MLFLAMQRKGHAPSQYRAILRELKSGKTAPKKLLDESRALGDSYAAQALFDISSDQRLSLTEAKKTADEALSRVVAIERQWSKAEVLKMLVKKAESWRGGAGGAQEALLEKIKKIILSMPNGQGLSDAIRNCASHFNCNQLEALLSGAVANTGFENTDVKAVIKAMEKRCDSISTEAIRKHLTDIDDRATRAKLLGYLYLQTKKRGAASETIFQNAVDTALHSDNARLETLRYCANIATDTNEFKILEKAHSKLADPTEKAKFMATLAGSADLAKLRDLAHLYFEYSINDWKEIDNDTNRALVLANIAHGFAKSGDEKQARALFDEALSLDADDKTQNKIAKMILSHGFEAPEIKKPQQSTTDVKMKKSSKNNQILALYDTYEGGLKQTHFRAIARAAPLCAAFDLDLALMGFPVKDLDDLINQVVSETNIGRGGKILRALEAQHRIYLVPCTTRAPPRDWSTLGLPIVTTSKPDETKRITMDAALYRAKKEHPQKRVCIIMGVGRAGLPKSLLDAALYHLELTGRNVPLETCTVMGVIAEQLHEKI